MAKTTARPSSALKQDYQESLQKAADLFPKADQKLILSMLYYETLYSDWEGNVLLKVVYPSGTDMERKKEMVYSRYQRMPSIEQDKTVRFKAIRMYIEELDSLIRSDPDIEFVTGSATLTLLRKHTLHKSLVEQLNTYVVGDIYHSLSYVVTRFCLASCPCTGPTIRKWISKSICSKAN